MYLQNDFQQHPSASDNAYMIYCSSVAIKRNVKFVQISSYCEEALYIYDKTSFLFKMNLKVKNVTFWYTPMSKWVLFDIKFYSIWFPPRFALLALNICVFYFHIRIIYLCNVILSFMVLWDEICDTLSIDVPKCPLEPPHWSCCND